MKKFSVSNIAVNLVFMFYSLCCIIPLLLVLSISLTDEGALARGTYKLIPTIFSFKAYEFILGGKSPIPRAYLITIIVTIAGTILNLAISSMLAYAISRKEVRYRGIVSFVLVFCLLFNGGLVPWYILIAKYLGMKDTIFAMFVPYMVSSVYVIMMRNFFMGIPESIIESARIDGSGEFNTFLKIVLPLSKPIFATIALFVGVFLWNDWYTCSLFVNNQKLYSLQFLLQSIMNNIDYLQGNVLLEKVAANLPSESARMATCVLAVGPILIAYPYLQKYFEKGLTLGAVKS